MVRLVVKMLWTFNADFKTVTNTGQFIVAIDLAAFGDVIGFKRQVDDVIRAIKASPTLPGFDQALLQDTSRKKTKNKTNGIPLPTALVTALNGLAEEVGVEPSEPKINDQVDRSFLAE